LAASGRRGRAAWAVGAVGEGNGRVILEIPF
jgi:hypothetical protein